MSKRLLVHHWQVGQLLTSWFGDDTFYVGQTICWVTFAKEYKTKPRARNQAYVCPFVEYHPQQMVGIDQYGYITPAFLGSPWWGEKGDG